MSNEQKMKYQQGFTLIELVIVVVILGFLAVTAIPKFLDLTDQAKEANIEGMAGGFATGVSLVRAQWEAEGRPTSSNVNQVNYDGTVFVLTTPPANSTTIRPGYPVGLVVGNAATATMTNARCIEVWQGVFAQPPSITNVLADLNSTTQSFNYFVSTTTATTALANTICVFHLKESLNQNGAGEYTNPAGDITIGNNFTYDPANSQVSVHVKKT